MNKSMLIIVVGGGVGAALDYVVGVKDPALFFLLGGVTILGACYMGLRKAVGEAEEAWGGR